MRRFFQIFWAALAAIVIIPVAGGYFTELAKEHGLYEHPSARAEAVMVWLINLTAHPAYIVTASIAFGLAVGMWMDAVLRRREAKNKSPLEILFDSSPLHVEIKQGLHGPITEFYSIGIENTGHPTIANVPVRALDSWFTREAIAAGQYGQRRTFAAPVELICQSELHPHAPEYKQMFGLSYASAASHPDYIFNKKQRFIIEALGKDTAAVRKEFEYDPKARPMLRVVD